MKNACSMLWFAAVAATAAPAAGAAETWPAYSDYRAVLIGFVDDQGLVDYASLKGQRELLDAFTVALESLDPKVYDGWGEKDKIAFWINAYNALTLQTIIDHYPIDMKNPNLSYPLNSIRQIPGVWDRARAVVMGRSMTLGYIETQILRRDFHEPRIHVALVCAARSCPKLRAEPYQGAALDAQLDDQARAFLSDPRNLRIDRARGEVHASEIFKWYADDFLPAVAGNKDRTAAEKKALSAFAGKYLGEEDRKFLATTNYRLSYLKYDWTLNEQTR